MPSAISPSVIDAHSDVELPEESSDVSQAYASAMLSMVKNMIARQNSQSNTRHKPNTLQRRYSIDMLLRLKDLPQCHLPPPSMDSATRESLTFTLECYMMGCAEGEVGDTSYLLGIPALARLHAKASGSVVEQYRQDTVQVLNKITVSSLPHFVDQLVQLYRSLLDDTVSVSLADKRDILSQLAREIYEKACLEPNFAKLYVRLFTLLLRSKRVHCTHDCCECAITISEKGGWHLTSFKTKTITEYLRSMEYPYHTTTKRKVVLNTHHKTCRAKAICEVRETSVHVVDPELSFPMVPLAFTSPTTLLCRPSTAANANTACVCELTLPTETERQDQVSDAGADTTCSGRELGVAPSFLLKGDCHTLLDGGCLYMSQKKGRAASAATPPYFVRYDIGTRQWTQLEWSGTDVTLGAFAVEGSLYYICRVDNAHNVCKRYETDTQEWEEIPLYSHSMSLIVTTKAISTAVTSDGVVHLFSEHETGVIRRSGVIRSHPRNVSMFIFHHTFSPNTGFSENDFYRRNMMAGRDITAIALGRCILLAEATPFDTFAAILSEAEATLRQKQSWKHDSRSQKEIAKRTRDNLLATPSHQHVLDTVTGQWMTEWEVPDLSHATVLQSGYEGSIVYMEHGANMTPTKKDPREVHYAECDHRMLYPSPSMLWARVKDT
ncbi:hypothetical protein KIPB_001127 [Kipferlia bialata]|uniref:Uncharacterized protein n=1 Tax=Kipferlia bialata TaxID=797122 RepID=A0A9K3CQ68_9EUKA|nr:hypothetical protein KIPB_001127 [Kipferlia bialata]|eukprot:g1127.t1